MDTDPNLAQAGADPTQRVPAPAFITKPLPATLAPETKYYFCPVQAASMHRTDGKKIAFVQGICETNLIHDQMYLENEINGGSTYVRAATPNEIRAYQMHKDPRGTLKAEVREEVRGELEDELRRQIEKEVREKYEAEGRVSSAAVQTDGLFTPPAPVSESSVEASNTAASSIAGTDARARLEALKSKTGTGATVLMESQRPPITPVSTADLADASKSSGK